MTRLTRLALDHAPITILLALLVLVGGSLALRSLKQELVPEVQFPLATVITVWPGAAADQVTTSVTKPIEDALQNLDNVSVVSVSSQTTDSFSAVTVRADYGTKQADLRDAIQRQLDGVTLPDEAEAPEILLLDINAIPVASLSASGNMPVEALQQVVDKVIVPKLEAIDGVGQVTLAGAGQDEIQIVLDPTKMAAAGVTLDTVRNVLAANNVSLPAGELSAAGTSVPVIVGNVITDVMAIRALPLAPAAAAAGGASGQGGTSAGQTEAVTTTSAAAAATEPVTSTAQVRAEPAVTATLAAGPAVTATLAAGTPLTATEAAASVPAATAAPLAGFWEILGATEASEITPEMMRLAVRDGLDAVQALSPAQLEALPTETLREVPPSIIQSQPPEVRDRLLARIAALAPAASATAPAAPAASATSGAPAAAAAAGASGLVTLGDIATVERVFKEGSTVNRTDGQPSLGISVSKQQDANTVKVVNDIKDAVDTLGQEQGITFNMVFEQGSYIEESLAGVRNEGLLGALFAVIVILFFLNMSVRSTLVIALSIPLSILFAFLLMLWQGMTLNILTLAGLTIAIGRVVDDAIVVFENIFRHIQLGENRTASVLEGTREVARAVTASTLVAVAVFLPLGYVGGLTRQFFQPFALTTTYALVGSLIVALTVIPILARALLRRDVLPEQHETWLQRAYTPVLAWALDHRWLTLVLSILFFAASMLPLAVIPQTFLPSFGKPALTVNASLAAGTDLATTDAFARQVEDMLLSDEDIQTVETTVGSASRVLGLTTANDSSKASFYASFATVDQSFYERLTNNKEVDPKVVADRVRGELANLVGSQPITYSVSTAAASGFDSTGFDLQIQSANDDALREANALALAALKDPQNWKQPQDWIARLRNEEEKVPTEVPIINLSSNLLDARPVLAVTVDPAKALARGLTAAQVGLALRAVLEGTDLGTVNVVSDSTTAALPVVAVFPSDTLSSTEALQALTIPSATGPVALASIATVERRPGAVQITRIDGERAAVISGEITAEDTFGTLRQARKIVDDLAFDTRFGKDVVTVGSGVESSEREDAFRTTAAALPLSILVVYLIMVVTFRSLVHPFTILLSLPFAGSGAVLALWMTGRSLSIPTLIGLMMLIGIVLANAIVLIDLAQQHRSSGLDARTSLIRAGRTRLRPILMTATATVLALLPQALEITGRGGLIAADLATTVIGGLITSTLLTLLVVPVVYMLLDPLSRRGGSEAAGEPGPAPGPPGQPAPPPPAESQEPLPSGVV